MADARDYVLAIENNKPAALQIATETASSKSPNRTLKGTRLRNLQNCRIVKLPS